MMVAATDPSRGSSRVGDNDSPGGGMTVALVAVVLRELCPRMKRRRVPRM